MTDQTLDGGAAEAEERTVGVVKLTVDPGDLVPLQLGALERGGVGRVGDLLGVPAGAGELAHAALAGQALQLL